MSVEVHALDHLVINVRDVERTAQWYRNILGMEIKVFDPGNGKTPRTSLHFGQQKINVRPLGADKVEWFTADHETAGSDDLCFLTAASPEAVVSHLKSARRGDRRRPNRKARRARHVAFGVLPRPRRQPDRDFIVRRVARLDEALG